MKIKDIANLISIFNYLKDNDIHLNEHVAKQMIDKVGQAINNSLLCILDGNLDEYIEDSNEIVGTVESSVNITSFESKVKAFPLAETISKIKSGKFDNEEKPRVITPYKNDLFEMNFGGKDGIQDASQSRIKKSAEKAEKIIPFPTTSSSNASVMPLDDTPFVVASPYVNSDYIRLHGDSAEQHANATIDSIKKSMDNLSQTWLLEKKEEEIHRLSKRHALNSDMDVMTRMDNVLNESDAVLAAAVKERPRIKTSRKANGKDDCIDYDNFVKKPTKQNKAPVNVSEKTTSYKKPNKKIDVKIVGQSVNKSRKGKSK